MKSYGEKGRHYFIGYYDIDPYNSVTKQVLILNAPRISGLPKVSDKATVGTINLQNHKFSPLADTSAWNWQQGAKTYFNQQNLDEYFYSNIVDGEAVTLRANSSGVLESYKYCFYDYSLDSTSGVSIDLRIINKLRPHYGYSNYNHQINQNEVVIYDLKKNQIRKIIKMEELFEKLRIKAEPSNYFFDHPKFSSDGNSIFIYLQPINKLHGRRRLLQIFFNENHIIDFKIQGQISHFCERSGRIIAFVIGGIEGNGYYEFSSLNNSEHHKLEFLGDLDGHPIFIADNYLITDTYPNKLSIQSLYGINLISNQIEKRKLFYSNPFYRNINRCDLHPKFSPKANKLFLDSTHRGLRRVVSMDLKDFY